ncbi:hypothetical protein GUJ93_ZPchr0002g26087 [Zizania palustris]|uniref:Uncharacterized protein n=1 Tax=Zizania palustris TaxID=103762 RepID=A0A8J5SPV4_ZIZPA|nr:hypothetical protein GUJ93_ZPchr0002g26087 [Zizania palustris]
MHGATLRIKTPPRKNAAPHASFPDIEKARATAAKQQRRAREGDADAQRRRGRGGASPPRLCLHPLLSLLSLSLSISLSPPPSPLPPPVHSSDRSLRSASQQPVSHRPCAPIVDQSRLAFGAMVHHIRFADE